MTIITSIKTEKFNFLDKNQNMIENHKKTATHLAAAAKHHLDAAKLHESGDYEKAARSIAAAQAQCYLADETQKKNSNLIL